MIVILEISDSSLAVLTSHGVLAERAGRLLRDGLTAAAAAGADHVGELLQTNRLNLKTRRGGMGTAGQVTSWPIDADYEAVGIPANSEASAWAGIQEEGGTIYPKNAKALAVPVNPAARMYTSPRDVPVELEFIKRRGKPPLLARVIGDQLVAWYVLLASVTLPATHWLSDGVMMSLDVMVGAFQTRLDAAIPGVMEGRA
jgi:hypothetical protein